MRRLSLALLLALLPGLASAQMALIAPNLPAGDNSDRIANSAYVESEISRNSTHFAAGGTATCVSNALTIASVSPPIFSFTGNPTVTFSAGCSITGATTLNVAASGAKNVLRKTATGLVALVTNDIISGQQYLVTYDGTQYELQTPSSLLPSSASALGGVTSATAPANNFQTGISTAGAPTFAQPSFSNLSGTLSGAQLPAGVDTNVLAGGAVITSAPTVNSTFCGTTAALGGNAFYAFTVGAASGFTANCVLTVANVDGWVSGRGKSLSVSGLTIAPGSTLYPTQVIKFRNINNTWVQDPVYQLVRAPLGQKLFFDAAVGSNSNDCLATGSGNACLDPGGYGIMTLIWNQLLGTGGSSTGGNPTFDLRLATNVACVPTTGVGCYAGMHLSGALKQVEGFNSIMVECDGGSATNCTMADSSGNCAIGLFNPAINMEIKNITLAGGSGNNCDIEATSGQIRIEGGVVLGPTGSASVAQLQADGLTGKIIAEGGVTVSVSGGSSGYLALASFGGQVLLDSATLSFLANTTYGQQTLSAIEQGLVSAGGTTWTLNAHTITTAHNINTATGGWVVTNGTSANVPGTNSPIGTLTGAGSYN